MIIFHVQSLNMLIQCMGKAHIKAHIFQSLAPVLERMQLQQSQHNQTLQNQESVPLQRVPTKVATAKCHQMEEPETTRVGQGTRNPRIQRCLELDPGSRRLGLSLSGSRSSRDHSALMAGAITLSMSIRVRATTPMRRRSNLRGIIGGCV